MSNFQAETFFGPLEQWRSAGTLLGLDVAQETKRFPTLIVAADALFPDC